MNRASERLLRSPSRVPDSIHVVPNARLYIVSGLHLGMHPALLGTPSSSFLGGVHVLTEWALSLATVWSIVLDFVGNVPSLRLDGSDWVDTMHLESGTNKERLI